MMNKRQLKGFTLIEILVVVGLIAILAAITIVAINPAKNFADTRNTQRSSDVQQILNAMWQYAAEPGHAIGDFGAIPLCTATPAVVSALTSGTPPAGTIGLYTLLVDTYIADIPLDPVGGVAANTGYTVCRTAGNRLQIAAPNAENGKTIVVKK
jgi:type IV pilus assembly protein PilA